MDCIPSEIVWKVNLYVVFFREHYYSYRDKLLPFASVLTYWCHNLLLYDARILIAKILAEWM